MEQLAQEYRLLFETYEGFNDQSIGIKEWSVTVGMAALIGAYAVKPSDRPGRMVVLLAALSVLPFWITDALWKVIQSGYVPRLRALELAFQTGATDAPYQSFNTWDLEAKIELWPFLMAMKNPTVFLPHLPIMLAGLILAAIAPPRQPLGPELTRQ